MRLGGRIWPFLGRGAYNCTYTTPEAALTVVVDGHREIKTEHLPWVYKVQHDSIANGDDQFQAALDLPEHMVRIWKECNRDLPAYLYEKGYVAPYIDGSP